MLKKFLGAAVLALSLCVQNTCLAGILDFPTVAVVCVDNKAAIPTSLAVGDLSIAADILADELFCTGMFDMVERDKLYEVFREQAFQFTGAVDNATAARIGNIVGAQYVVVGSINNLSTANSHFGYGNVGRSGGGLIDGNKNSVSCNMTARIIDVTTGRIALAGRGAGKSSRAGVELGFVQSRRHYGPHHYRPNAQFISIGSDEVTGQMAYNALEKAVIDAVNGKSGLLARLNGPGKRK